MALEAVVAGDNCIDRYLPPDAVEYVGGQAVNVAAGLAARGIATAYAGVVGSDDAGARVVAELRRRGLDLGALEIRPGRTGVTEIATDGRDRRFVTEDYGVSAPYAPSMAALALAREVGLVYAAHVDDLRPLRRALRPGALLAFDASEAPPGPAVLGDVDVLFRSTPGLEVGPALVESRSLLRQGPAIVVTTLGAAGAVVATESGAWAHQPPAGSVAADTLGAGDALAAGFLAAWLRGAAVDAALAAGTAAAHEACSHPGALPSP